MKSKFLYLSIALPLLFLSSCKEEVDAFKATQELPPSSGARCEILVVSKKKLWTDVPGQRLQKLLAAPQSGLPQAEPWFKLIFIENQNFSGFLERNKSIIVMEEGETNDFIWIKNKWSKPQNIAFFEYNDLDSLDAMIRLHWKDIFETFRNEDIKRVTQLLEKISQKKYKALKNPSYQIKLPKGFVNIVDKEDLRILFNRGKQSDQGIIIANKPAPAEFFTFNEREVYAWRDSITRKHIESSREGSFTIVDTVMPPVTRYLEFNGMIAIESRGLYRSVGDIMGGPFLNYVLYDEKNKQFIMLDAFLLALGQDKRNLMLELEVMLKTFQED